MPRDPREVFPERLRFYLERPDQEQKAFAQEHGFDTTSLNKLLKAKSVNVEIKTVWKYAQALETSVADLLTDPEEEAPRRPVAAMFDGDRLPVHWQCPRCGATLTTTIADT